jgi:hypothetical protein
LGRGVFGSANVCVCPWVEDAVIDAVARVVAGFAECEGDVEVDCVPDRDVPRTCAIYRLLVRRCTAARVAFSWSCGIRGILCGGGAYEGCSEKNISEPRRLW